MGSALLGNGILQPAVGTPVPIILKSGNAFLSRKKISHNHRLSRLRVEADASTSEVRFVGVIDICISVL